MLSSAIWFVEFYSWSNITKSKTVVPKYLLLVGSVLLCNITKCLKKGVADPTRIQLAIAIRYGKFLLFWSDNVVYMNVVNNTNTIHSMC